MQESCVAPCYEAVEDETQRGALVALSNVLLRWFAHEPATSMVRADDTWLLAYYIEEIDRALLFELQCSSARPLLYSLKDDHGRVHNGLNLFTLVDDAFFACLENRPGMDCDTCTQMIFNARSLVTLDAMLRHGDALCDNHIEEECKPNVLVWTREVLGKKRWAATSWLDKQRWTELAGDTVGATRLSLEAALAQCILPVGSTEKKMCLHTCDCKYQPKDAANARKHAQFSVPTQIKLAHLEAVRAGTVVCNACDVYFTCQLFDGKTQHQAMEREIQRFKDTLGRRKDKRKATGDSEEVTAVAEPVTDALKRSRNDDDAPDFSEKLLEDIRARVVAAAEADVAAMKPVTPRVATRTPSAPSRHIIVNSFNMFKKLTEKFERSIIYVNASNVLCNAKGQLVDADDNYTDQPVYFDVDENLLPDFANDDITSDGCYHILRYCVDDYGTRIVTPLRFKGDSDSGDSGDNGDSDSDGGNDTNGTNSKHPGQNGSTHKESSSTSAPNGTSAPSAPNGTSAPSMSEQLFDMCDDDNNEPPATTQKFTRSVSLSNINSWARHFITRIDSTSCEASDALTTSRFDAEANNNDPLWISMRYKNLQRSEGIYRREFSSIREELLRLFENIRLRCTEASTRMASQEEEHVVLRRDNARFNVDIHEAIKLRDEALARANVLLCENGEMFAKANEWERMYLSATSLVHDDTWKERATQLREKLATATSESKRLTNQLASLEERLGASESAQQNGAVQLHVAHAELAEANAIVAAQRVELEALRAQSATMDVSRRIADGASAICSQIASDIQEHDAAQPHVAAPRPDNTLFLDFAGRVFDSILQQAVDEIRMSMQLLFTLAEQFKVMCAGDESSPVLRQAESALRAKLELMNGKIQTFETLNGAFKRSIEAPHGTSSTTQVAIEMVC